MLLSELGVCVSSRRGFLLGGLGSIICAPAIVRAASLMPVKAYPEVMESVVITKIPVNRFLNAQEYADTMLLMLKNQLELRRRFPCPMA